jgi:hypothetical protein
MKNKYKYYKLKSHSPGIGSTCETKCEFDKNIYIGSYSCITCPNNIKHELKHQRIIWRNNMKYIWSKNDKKFEEFVDCEYIYPLNIDGEEVINNYKNLINELYLFYEKGVNYETKRND